MYKLIVVVRQIAKRILRGRQNFVIIPRHTFLNQNLVVGDNVKIVKLLQCNYYETNGHRVVAKVSDIKACFGGFKLYLEINEAATRAYNDRLIARVNTDTQGIHRRSQKMKLWGWG